MNSNTLELIGHENRLQAVNVNVCEGQNKNSEHDFFDLGMIGNKPGDFIAEFEAEHEICKNGCLRYDKNDLAYYFARINFYKAWRKIKELQSMTQCWLSDNKPQEDQPKDDYNHYYPFDKEDCAEFYDDVQVLVIHDYPIIYAYKIGLTFEECKLIGCHHDICFLYKSICIFLDSEKKKKDHSTKQNKLLQMCRPE